MPVFRMCAVCRERREKEGLLRITRINENHLSIDLTQKLPGRGMYVCKSKKCISFARKKRILEKSLSVHGTDIYDELEKMGELFE